MWLVRTLLLTTLNASIASGVVAVALLALRPLTRRLLPARYWPWLWAAVCYPIFYTSLRSLRLPWSFFSFIPGQRVSTGSTGLIEYFPRELQDGGTLRDIVLPGGFTLYSGDAAGWYALTDRVFSLAAVIWLAGVVALVLVSVYQTMRLDAITEHAERMPAADSVFLRGLENSLDGPSDYEFYLCAGMPTSFLRAGLHNNPRVYIQKELPPDQRELVLCHEYNHIVMRHVFLKLIFLTSCVACWYNPLIWIAYHFYCRDMEFACDEKTLSQLPTEKRAAYTQTLLDCASAAPMPGSPTSFAETDAENRIKAALRFRPLNRGRRAAGWLATAAIFLFFVMGPAENEWATAVQEASLSYPRFVEQQGGFAKLEDYVPAEFTKDVAAAAYSDLVTKQTTGGIFFLRVTRQDGAVYDVTYCYNGGRFETHEYDVWPEKKDAACWNDISLDEKYL